eukprot:364081-Chlamydomonas_euryale.AAC.2
MLMLSQQQQQGLANATEIIFGSVLRRARAQARAARVARWRKGGVCVGGVWTGCGGYRSAEEKRMPKRCIHECRAALPKTASLPLQPSRPPSERPRLRLRQSRAGGDAVIWVRSIKPHAHLNHSPAGRGRRNDCERCRGRARRVRVSCASSRRAP